MSQKELLYVEDAIGHENIIISMCNEALNTLEDKNLITFMQKELKNHTTTYDKLLSLLEDNSK